MKRTTNKQIRDAVAENFDFYHDEMMNAVSRAINGIAHDATADLWDGDGEWDEAEDANLLKRAKIAARLLVDKHLRGYK